MSSALGNLQETAICLWALGAVLVLFGLFLCWDARQPYKGDHGDGTNHTWEPYKFETWRCSRCGLLDGPDSLLDGPR